MFRTDATVGCNSTDPRLRFVAYAALAFRWSRGKPVQVASIRGVLPPDASVVDGETHALKVLLAHTKGRVDVTSDCQPAIKRTKVFAEYGDLFINEEADKSCGARAAELHGLMRANRVRQLDQIATTVSCFLADRAEKLILASKADPPPQQFVERRRGSRLKDDLVQKGESFNKTARSASLAVRCRTAQNVPEAPNLTKSRDFRSCCASLSSVLGILGLLARVRRTTLQCPVKLVPCILSNAMRSPFLKGKFRIPVETYRGPGLPPGSCILPITY